jgi:23S rRNA (pseudouridine1915-N3)-methyltransferase
MKIELWSIGKPNDKIFDAAIKEFEKRINKYNKFNVVTISSKAVSTAPVATIIKQEGVQIISLLNDQDFLVILDDKQEQYTTQNFALAVQKWTNTSYKRIVFLIGGAYGISEEVKKTAQAKMSLSKLTFPHQLVRLIFCEQLYRAYSVLNNEQYHHE